MTEKRSRRPVPTNQPRSFLFNITYNNNCNMNWNNQPKGKHHLVIGPFSSCFGQPVFGLLCKAYSDFFSSSSHDLGGLRISHYTLGCNVCRLFPSGITSILLFPRIDTSIVTKRPIERPAVAFPQPKTQHSVNVPIDFRHVYE